MRREVSQVAMEGLDDLSGQLDILVIKTQAVLRNVSVCVVLYQNVILFYGLKTCSEISGENFGHGFSVAWT